MTAPALAWQIDPPPDGAGPTVVQLVGEIDEHADLGAVADRLAGKVVIDLGKIRRINSVGVRAWIDFVRALEDRRVRDLAFRCCSPAVITQVNMIANFRGPARIESFYAPYICDACGNELEHLIDVGEQIARDGEVPDVACPSCGAPMSFDDLPERYLSFLTDEAG